ncbi:MAG TPA: hypothetical protein VN643_20245 [Pyrinomonadaceae bacterium]|nr:hypothetical protein [Pyrinomonadaceae bacterium]
MAIKRERQVLFKATALSVCLISIVWSSLTASSDSNSVVSPQQPASRHRYTLSQQQRERIRENFKRGRELLQEKGVPFEPEELLNPNWHKNLKLSLSQLPEMQAIRVVGKQIKGVHLADTLYLPEKVELTGDTVILANQVIFEGQHALIKGNYNVYFFPAVFDGVLGMSLEAAIKEQGRTFSTVSYKTSKSTNLIVPPTWFVPRLLKKGWSITIDTSGKGWPEWLEEQEKKKAMKVGFVKTSLQGETIDNSGQTGGQGGTGTTGPPTCNGGPNPATSGADGWCAANAPNDSFHWA